MLVKQIKALSTSQSGVPLELDVSVTLEGMCWALGQTQPKERVPLRPPERSQLWKGAETQYIPIEQNLLAQCFSR